MTWQSLVLIGCMLIYIVVVIVALNSWDRQQRLNVIISEGRTDGMRLFFFENMLLDKLHLQPEKVRGVIVAERIAIIAAVVFCVVSIHGLALLLFGAILVVLFFNDAYRKCIYDSGIDNIPSIVSFINYFVPHINSGNSADQSLLGYINYSQNLDLQQFYEHRGELDYKLQSHIRQIVDIYDIAKYNEEKGVSDYTYILNEVAQDYAQKQVYYNSFVSRIGEIKPIMLAYYFCVPFLIVLSFQQTQDFWMGIGGVIVSVLTLIMFATFKFLIYRLQRDTIKGMF